MKRKGEGSHGKDIKKGTRLRCLVCGREVTVDKEGRGPLVCCMRPMHVIGNVSESKGKGGFRGFGPGAQDYYGQDVQGPGEFEDAEDPEKGEKKRKYYWRSEMHLDDYLEQIQEAGWQGMPKGWDKESVKKFAKSLRKGGAKKEGFFDACVKKMKDEKGFNKERAEGFCAGIKDEVYSSTYWRGKDKSPQEVGKDVKRHKNV